MCGGSTQRSSNAGRSSEVRFSLRLLGPRKSHKRSPAPVRQDRRPVGQRLLQLLRSQLASALHVGAAEIRHRELGPPEPAALQHRAAKIAPAHTAFAEIDVAYAGVSEDGLGNLSPCE